MSHIPASAMPHAAPHHPDSAEPVPDDAPMPSPAASGAGATIRDEAAPPPTDAASPARSGWALAALAAGGVALAAAVTVSLPRRANTPTSRKRRDGKA